MAAAVAEDVPMDDIEIDDAELDVTPLKVEKKLAKYSKSLAEKYLNNVRNEREDLFQLQLNRKDVDGSWTTIRETTRVRLYMTELCTSLTNKLSRFYEKLDAVKAEIESEEKLEQKILKRKKELKELPKQEESERVNYLKGKLETYKQKRKDAAALSTENEREKNLKTLEDIITLLHRSETDMKEALVLQMEIICIRLHHLDMNHKNRPNKAGYVKVTCESDAIVITRILDMKNHLAGLSLNFVIADAVRSGALCDMVEALERSVKVQVDVRPEKFTIKRKAAYCLTISPGGRAIFKQLTRTEAAAIGLPQ